MKTQEADGVVSTLVKDTVSTQVKGAVLVALRSLNFQKIVTDLVQDHVSSGYLPANKVDFSAYSFRDFLSTGIEDKSNSLQLRILNDNIVVENNFIAESIKVKDSIEAGKQIRANVLDIVGSSLFGGDTLMLGKLTTQGENEFKGHAKFSSGIDVTFKDNQIPHGAINWAGYRLDQSQVVPGKIENFNSSGIQDEATGTQLSINDKVVSVSQKLQSDSIDTSRITVSGTANFINIESKSIASNTLNISETASLEDVNVGGKLTVQNDLDVQGTITLPDNIKDDLVQYMTKHFKWNVKIPEGGSLTIGNRDVIKEQSLGNTVINSNLRKVGTLTELVVSGETNLAGSVYFSPLGRIGVNTEEPTAPLDIWDEGVQVTIGKNKAKTGWVGTGRDHDLELGVNRDPKITITQDSTIIKNPVLDDRRFTQGPDIPGIDGATGDIHWNTNPKIGKPVGWVCLGNTRWATFGNIE
jgi:hypothetical protein